MTPRKYSVLCLRWAHSMDGAEEGIFDTMAEAIAFADGFRSRNRAGYYRIYRTVCALVNGAWIPVATF